MLRPVSSFAQHKSKLPPEILSAKSVYLDDRIGSAAISREMVVQLRKWGRFQIVNDPKDADLVLLLSADPYKDGELIFSNGQTGSIDIHGNIKEDPVPTFNKQAPVRYAYLTAIDPRTRQSLWSADHQWGGLLTGFNSVGARLLNKLKKQIEK
ncbi:MAG: hypothetical protein ACRD5M_13215 [Candidatus Acidiferrales bacterium]